MLVIALFIAHSQFYLVSLMDKGLVILYWFNYSYRFDISENFSEVDDGSVHDLPGPPA
jgi:hypothetical protein